MGAAVTEMGKGKEACRVRRDPPVRTGSARCAPPRAGGVRARSPLPTHSARRGVARRWGWSAPPRGVHAVPVVRAATGAGDAALSPPPRVRGGADRAAHLPRRRRRVRVGAASGWVVVPWGGHAGVWGGPPSPAAAAASAAPPPPTSAGRGRWRRRQTPDR